MQSMSIIVVLDDKLENTFDLQIPTLEHKRR